MVFNATFNLQYFSYILAVSFIGGGNHLGNRSFLFFVDFFLFSITNKTSIGLDYTSSGRCGRDRMVVGFRATCVMQNTKNDKISDKAKHIMKILHINVNIYNTTATSQQNSD
jgi:hypothetical protein